MHVFQARLSVRNTARRGQSSAAIPAESRSLADRLAQLNASIRRQPEAAAGVIEFWLRKETN